MTSSYTIVGILFLIVLLAGCATEKQSSEHFSEKTQFSKQDTYPKQTKMESSASFSKLERTHFSRVGETKNAHWIRLWVTWGGVEREKGVYDFSYYDAIIRRAGEDGTLLLITIMPFAEWDQDRCHGEEYYGKMPMPEGKVKIKVGKPCSMEDYRSFLRKFVERYDGDGIDDMPGLIYPVKYWEIMNEPGMQGKDPSGLKFFYGAPQEYLEILKVSYTTIKEVDPEAKVLMAGMAGMHKQFVEFWDPILSEAKDYFDIANIHSIDTDEKREDLFVLEFKEFLKSHGIEKPIWVTEAQFGALGFEWEKGKELSEEEMNKLIVRSTVLALALGADKIFFISDNWKYKSTFKVYETLVEKLNYFDSLEVIDQKYVRNKGKDAGVTSIYGYYKFKIGNKTLYVLWGKGKLSEIVDGTVKVTDIYGKVVITKADEVALSDFPVYVEVLEHQR